ncbi:hypothetical protein ACP4OV_023324 [Aristida adscensionis]
MGCHPRRWMLLPEGHGLWPGRPELSGRVRFLNLDTGTLARPRIPLLATHCAIDSVDGLLLLLPWEPFLQDDAPVLLLHPFTGDAVQLPPLATLLPQMDAYDLGPYKITRLTGRGVCASLSFDAAGVMTVMLSLHMKSRVAFATSMDRQWTLSTWSYQRTCSEVSFQGKLYTVHSEMSSGMHRVFQIDPPAPPQPQEQGAAGRAMALQPPKLIATVHVHKLGDCLGLVECGSELLVLFKDRQATSRVLVCKLADLVLQRFAPLNSIGGSVLFRGGRNISVCSKVLPMLMGDSVVYRCNKEDGLYHAEYHLSSGTFSPAMDDCRLYGDAPGPSSLVHHIFSCCFRYQWPEDYYSGGTSVTVIGAHHEEEL